MPPRRVTLADVARRVGVSAATVSRYVNDPARVRPSLRPSIQAAIDDLAYLPHAAARSLASARSRLIGAVFPSLQTSLFGGALEALQNEIAPAGYTLVVASSGYDPAREATHIQTLLANGVDALMLVGGARDASVERLVARHGVPCVITWVRDYGGPFPCIGFDNERAAAEATEHLLDLGHRRVAVLSGLVAGNDRAGARVAGVRRALAARNLALAAGDLLQSRFGVEEGRVGFRRLMARSPRPTALLCGAEPFAYGALMEAAEMGVAVPGDLSVVGFDDMWLAAHIRPALTTVRTPRAEMGALAGRYLMAALAGEPPALPRPLPYQLIVRRSSGPAPRG